MTVETETILIKLLEELKSDVKELKTEVNQVNINLARLEGKVDVNRVEIQNVKEDIKDLKTGNRWIFGLVVTIVGSIIYIVSNLLPKI